MSYVVLCDIDGVLADCEHRLHFQREKDYDSFYNSVEISHDAPIRSGLTTLRAFQNHESTYTTILMTGRPEKTREATINWLADHRVDYDEIIMREDGDHRKSGVVKVELIQQRMDFDKKTGLDVEYIFIDDDPENVLAVGKAFPEITCLLFGTQRLVSSRKEQ